MKKLRFKNKHAIFSAIVSMVICLIVIYLHLLSHEKTQEIYLQQTEATIIDIKKEFLKDTVNNVFLEIDTLRETKYSNYKKNTELRLKRFKTELSLTEIDFAEFFIKQFSEEEGPQIWTAFLQDTRTGETLYGDPDLESQLLSSAIIEEEGIKGIFGVKQSYVDELVKEELEEAIRDREFSGDSYIWITEILNYEGGKDYAIRRVHPNLPHTEGDYLSTDMQDVAGGFPYLTELEGIKENGDLFFNYHFKELNSQNISEKLTYAKLYNDYNWVIAMGVHLNDIDQYAGNIKEEIKHLAAVITIRVLRYILLALLIGFVSLYLIDRNNISKSTKFLEKEINLDTLTKAYSRRYGEKSLNAFFKKFQASGEQAAIMMLDVDSFKEINDAYGHQAGDATLVEVVKTINEIIRSSDQVIRWGGDEFICILPGFRGENVVGYGEKLLGEISKRDVRVNDTTINASVSVGISYFKDTDVDYNDVLKRADGAMYKSKEKGKNRASILL